MVVDGRVYVGRSLFGYELTPEAALEAMNRVGIGRAVLFPVRPSSYDLPPSNDYVAAAVSRHTDRFVGVARVDPWQGSAAVRELDRCVRSLGLRGLYLDPVEENFQINNELVFPLVARAGEHGLPVFIQAGYSRVSHPCQVGDLAAQFPHVAFVAANGGQLNISGMLLGEARQMLVDNPNVLIETSGTYREDFLEEVMTEVGQDRVVFASGAPRYDQEFEMERVNLAHLDDAAKSRMWSDNIRRVLAI